MSKSHCKIKMIKIEAFLLSAVYPTGHKQKCLPIPAMCIYRLGTNGWGSKSFGHNDLEIKSFRHGKCHCQENSVEVISDQVVTISRSYKKHFS
jgi:hypothetical protein